MQLSDRMVLTFPIGGREMAVLGGSEVETLWDPRIRYL
jgi:hypothetical protein